MSTLLVLFVLAAAVFLFIRSLFKNDGVTASDKETMGKEELKNFPTAQYDRDAKLSSQGYDVVIVGAGLGGAALATSLARAPLNYKVLVVESDMKKPDRIVGELLQPGGVRKLRALGFLDAIENIDSPSLVGYGVFMGDETVSLPYPDIPCPKEYLPEGFDASDDDKPVGRSFHYGDFVVNMRKKMLAEPNVTLAEGTVIKLIEDASGTTIQGIVYKPKDAKDDQLVEVRAPFTVVANGPGSNFTKKLNNCKPKTHSHFVGLLLKNGAEDLPFKWRGNVFMAKDGPILCYPISSTEVRCLIDFPPDKVPKDLATHIKEIVAPQLPENIRKHVILAAEEGPIKVALNREMPGDPMQKKGCLLLGDALNCRHPLTGGGMTVLLNDVYLLKKALMSAQLNERASNSNKNILYDNYMQEKVLNQFFTERKPVASTINILANALYAIFAARKDPMVPFMKQAVFEYFKVGGICATGPVGLLAGIIESYYTLLIHFFSVALVFICKQLFPFGWLKPSSYINGLKLLKSATFIIGPLIAEENILKWLFPPLIFKPEETK